MKLLLMASDAPFTICMHWHHQKGLPATLGDPPMPDAGMTDNAEAEPSAAWDEESVSRWLSLPNIPGEPVFAGLSAKESSGNIEAKPVLRIVPVYHNRAEFAGLVRSCILHYNPRLVAVELPEQLQQVFSRAVSRLPFSSVISYRCGEDNVAYIPIEPADALVESVRTCQEEGIECHFVDLAVSSYGEHCDPVLDSSVLTHLYLSTFYKICRSIPEAPKEPADLMRECYMAGRVRALLETLGAGESAMLICGLEHAAGIYRLLRHNQEADIFAKLKPESFSQIVLTEPDCDSIREIFAEMPFFNAIYEFRRGGPGPDWVWQGPEEDDADSSEENQEAVEVAELAAIADDNIKYQLVEINDDNDDNDDFDDNEDSIAVDSSHSQDSDELNSSSLLSTSSDELRANTSLQEVSAESIENFLDSYLSLLYGNDQSGSEQPELENKQNLAEGSAEASVTTNDELAFLGLSSLKLGKEKERSLINHLNSLRFQLRLPGEEYAAPPKPKEAQTPQEAKAFVFKTVLDRLPSLYLYLELLANSPFDRQFALQSLFIRSIRHYQENTGEEVKPYQRRVLMQFLRSYCSLHGQLMPSLYKCVVGAKGAVDDNFAYEVWDLGSFYPWLELDDGLARIKVRAEDVWINGTRTVRFRRRLPSMRRRIQKLVPNRRPQKKASDNWSDSFQNGGLYSYPPEDIVIEDYGRYLKKKGMQVISSEQTRTEEFRTSLLDGVDMRETLRNWHHSGKLYVQEIRKVKGGASCAVVIFSEDPEERYSWRITWQGEHDQESDMALYATPLLDKIVGPGIARCEYGGFLLCAPHGRLYNVWEDPCYEAARSKSEVLLMAAIDYSLERHIIYVAAKPPSARMHSFASKFGKKIVFLPIGQLSPITLKKLRVFHVLSDTKLRLIAKQFIW